MGVRRLAVVNGPNIFQMRLVHQTNPGTASLGLLVTTLTLSLILTLRLTLALRPYHNRNPDVQIYVVSQKNDSDVAHYNFNAHEPILVIFCRYVAE